MIKLHTFGPAFGTVDPSPFVIKAHVLLRMAKASYETVPADFRKAPKGKFPIIEDKGRIVPDSTLIRFYLEESYGVNFDAGVSPEGAAIGWAFEKMCEDHLYWPVVHDRWMVDANFDKGPRKFFDKAPALIRPLIIAMIRRKVRRNLSGQGNGRYTPEERFAIAARCIDAIAERLTHHPFIGGEQPCGADASVFGTIACMLTPYFDSASCAHARAKPALQAYHDRMLVLYFPADEAKKAA
jgi:glutathione S-transferase